MTSIVKHDPTSIDTPVRALEWSAFVRGETEGAGANPEVTELRAELARLEVELKALKAGEPDRIAAARAQGREDAERVYKADDEAKLAALRAGLDEALETARPTFANVEKIALLLAERALTNAFDDPEHYRDQIAGAIRRESKLVGAQMIVAVNVSRADFPDDFALSEVAGTLSLGARVTIGAEDDLAQGQARLGLVLGDIEIDLPRYWAEVRALLSELGAAS